MALRYHLATYDPDTYLVGDEIVSGTPTFVHTATIQSKNTYGYWEKFPANSIVLKGARAELDSAKLVGDFTTVQSPVTRLRIYSIDGSSWGIDFENRYVINGLTVNANYPDQVITIGDKVKIYAGDTSKISYYYCPSNNFNGVIPDMAEWTNLTRVDLSNNNLTGSLPNLTNLTSLNRIYVQNNNLTGEVIGLSSTISTTISAQNNNLSGSIPALPVEVVYVDMQANNFTGSIPDISANINLNIYNAFNMSGITGYVGGWPNKAFSFRVSGCALTETAVNLILTEADTYGIASGTTINLTGGTNAAPTGDGLTAKTNLISNGATVTTN